LSQCTQTKKLKPTPNHLSAAKVGKEIPQFSTKVPWGGFSIPITFGMIHPGTTQYPVDAFHVMLGLSKVNRSVGAIFTASGFPNHQFGLNSLLPTTLIDHIQFSHPPKQLLSQPPALHRATKTIRGDVKNEKQDEGGNNKGVAVLILDCDRGTSGYKEHYYGNKYMDPHSPEQALGELTGQQVPSSVRLQDTETCQTAAIGPYRGSLIG